MPTSTGTGLKIFTTPKIRVTRKGIYINPQEKFQKYPWRSLSGTEWNDDICPFFSKLNMNHILQQVDYWVILGIEYE